jgi:predicted DNA-binding protein
MPEKTFSKNGTVRARISDAARARLDAIHRRHKTNDTEIVTELIEAFIIAVEQVDAVRFPVAVLLAEKQLAVAESPPPTGLPKGNHAPGKPPDKSQRHRGDGPRAKVS